MSVMKRQAYVSYPIVSYHSPSVTSDDAKTISTIGSKVGIPRRRHGHRHWHRYRYRHPREDVGVGVGVVECQLKRALSDESRSCLRLRNGNTLKNLVKIGNGLSSREVKNRVSYHVSRAGLSDNKWQASERRRWRGIGTGSPINWTSSWLPCSPVDVTSWRSSLLLLLLRLLQAHFVARLLGSLDY